MTHVAIAYLPAPSAPAASHGTQPIINSTPLIFAASDSSTLQGMTLFVDKYLQEKLRGFTGRDWLVKDLQWHLRQEHITAKIILVQGDPGVGKTAFVAHLATGKAFDPRYSDHKDPAAPAVCVVAYHICAFENRVTTNASIFIENLAKHLCERVPEFRSFWTTSAELVLGSSDLVQSLAVLFLGLPRARPPGILGHACIVIDSLDESLLHQHPHPVTKVLPTIVQLLGCNSVQSALPPWLKIVATSRHDVTLASAYDSVRIDASSRQNEIDLQTYVKSRITSSRQLQQVFFMSSAQTASSEATELRPRPTLMNPSTGHHVAYMRHAELRADRPRDPIEYFISVCSGNFLVAKDYLNLLQDGTLTLDRVQGGGGDLASSTRASFYSRFSPTTEAGAQKWRLTRPIFEMIAARQIIGELAHRKDLERGFRIGYEGKQEYQDAHTNALSVCTFDEKTSTYAFHHRWLFEWLTGGTNNPDHRLDVSRGHKLLSFQPAVRCCLQHGDVEGVKKAVATHFSEAAVTLVDDVAGGPLTSSELVQLAKHVQNAFRHEVIRANFFEAFFVDTAWHKVAQDDRMYAAACLGFDGLVRCALKRNPKLLLPQPDGKYPTVLAGALVFGHHSLAAFLMEPEQKFPAEQPSQFRPLLQLIAESAAPNKELVKRVIAHYSLDVNEESKNKHRTALHIAAALPETTNALELLLELRADPSIRDSAGRSPLFFAACSGHAGKVRMLLAAKANVDFARTIDLVQSADVKLLIAEAIEKQRDALVEQQKRDGAYRDPPPASVQHLPPVVVAPNLDVASVVGILHPDQPVG